MLINEVVKITKLTKKAVEYYTEKGLISPEILENGYRNYKKEDIEILEKIFVYRNLNLSVDEIKKVLKDENELKRITINYNIKQKNEIRKSQLLEEILKGKKFEVIKKEIESLDKNKTIIEKLLDSFPGYYGRFIAIHFQKFLDITIETEEQERAYKRIIKFLDNILEIKFTKKVKDYIDEYSKEINNEMIEEVETNKNNAIKNSKEWLEENKIWIKEYMEYKKSEEYKNSPAFELSEQLKEFNKNTGYNEIFLKEMKKLSPKYKKYYEELEKANEDFIKLYPEI